MRYCSTARVWDWVWPVLGTGHRAIIDDSDSDEEVITETKTDSGDAMDNGGPSASEILTEIRNILFQDRAVPGQSAGLSLGLILCGSGNKQLVRGNDSIFARDTARKDHTRFGAIVRAAKT